MNIHGRNGNRFFKEYATLWFLYDTKQFQTLISYQQLLELENYTFGSARTSYTFSFLIKPVTYRYTQKATNQKYTGNCQNTDYVYFKQCRHYCRIHKNLNTSEEWGTFQQTLLNVNAIILIVAAINSISIWIMHMWQKSGSGSDFKI